MSDSQAGGTMTEHPRRANLIGGLVALALLGTAVVAVGAVAASAPTDNERLCAVEAYLADQGGPFEIYEECEPTTTTAATTTSSVAPSSTTTEPPTTTTVAPTTTTSPPATTTTTIIEDELVIPPTLPYPGGLNAGEGYRFEIACIDTTDLTCPLNAGGKRTIATFDYFGHGMPYLYPEAQEGMHQHAWWEDGDREGYLCEYGFMWNQHPNPFLIFAEPRPAYFIARVSVVRPLGQGYGKVNDKYMEEGERFYSGEVALGGGQEIPGENCQLSALTPDFDYEAYVPHGPDAIRVGLFREDGAIADIRDFTTVDVLVPGHFEFVSLEDGRATIVFILEVNNKVSHVIYYDTMNDGRIAVEVNGVTFQ